MGAVGFAEKKLDLVQTVSIEDGVHDHYIVHACPRHNELDGACPLHALL